MVSGSPFKGLYLFFCGMCMGAADLVPGISGGTVAFIMGFYHSLLESLKTINFSTLKLFLTFQFRLFFQQVAWQFLITLMAGIASSLFLFAGLFHYILEHEIYRIYFYASFMGLILASFVFCLRQIRKWTIKEALGLLIGAFIAYTLTNSTLSSEQTGFYAIKMEVSDHKQLSNYHPSLGLLTHLAAADLSALLAKGTVRLQTSVYNEQGDRIGTIADFMVPYHKKLMDGWLILCGAVAICALLLPGISGSYLLTLLGVYPLVIGALADLVAGLKRFSLDYEASLILLNLLVGIFIGAICFARFVSWLLRQYPNLTLAVLSGFMIGALRSVWPFWSYTYTLLPLKLHKGPQLQALTPIWPSWHSPFLWGACLCLGGGFILVFLIEYLAKQKTPLPASQE